MELIRRDNKNYVMERYYEAEMDPLVRGMLRSQSLHLLLPLEFRLVDDQVMTAFDISGRQPLARLFERRRMSREEIICLVHHVVQAGRELEEHLLGMEILCLTPDQVYADNSCREIRFCCHFRPTEGNEEGRYRKLLGFVLDVVDYSDKAGVGLAYSLVQAAEEEDPLQAMAQLIGEESAVPEVQEAVWETAPMTVSATSVPAAPVGLPEPPEEKKKKRRRPWLWGRKEREWLVEAAALPASVNERPERYRTRPLEHKLCEKEYHLQSLEEERDVLLDHFPFVIGKRQGDVDYVLDRDTVSRLHAQFNVADKGLTVEDLNSSNGTYVNGESVFGRGLVPLKDGDLVTLADIRFRLEIVGGGFRT